MNQQALDDVDVIDLGQIYNGAYGSLMLSYLGADVTKVEPPFGEPLRSRVEDGEGEPPELVMLNSTKEGITLNLKDDRGKELFKDLVRDADVLVENFAPGTMEQFGLGYETLAEINPELIYAHGSGFGEDGPKSDRLAMDLIVQAESGVMDATGRPDDPPTKTGIAPGDFLGGIHLAAGVLAALYQRKRTGEGQFVEASMQDAVYPSLMSQLANYYDNADVPARTGNRHSSLAKAPYNAYEADDGYVAILCTSDDHWRTLCEAIGRKDLRDDDRFATNVDRVEHMETIDTAIEEWTRERTREEIEETLSAVSVPCGSVQSVEEVIHDPHLEKREMVVEIDHPTEGEIRVPGMPIRLSESEMPDIEPAPRKGEGNHEIYRKRLGLSKNEIEKLQKDGVI
ncbi:CaiB/BaiF CoA transferase family protein [Halopiger aswanensis]|uniref:Crotonobetainyl-CoA:carnitine CoA-transferase CaiB-like acyl-CoA transferase n=1 Tax=Halopiger aswanensis TaxID=148449 RepID=A0A419VUS6_9EURY|nr:CoA transferase [Halopiger aswanensis]RKD85918.1 crotonobetainyl-CoA:carnitine CoA-transferase CaiB-like acyl-CoA transferase [Halopiger aswanensis]